MINYNLNTSAQNLRGAINEIDEKLDTDYSIYHTGLDFWVEGALEGDYSELLQSLINAWNSNKIIALQGTSGKAIVTNMAVDSVKDPTKVILVYSGYHPSTVLKTFRTTISATTITVQEVNAISSEVNTLSAMNNLYTKIII